MIGLRTQNGSAERNKGVDSEIKYIQFARLKCCCNCKIFMLDTDVEMQQQQ
jgi:hypothetical protein